MAEIENYGSLDGALFLGMTDQELVAQDLVQQGAIHAISFLLSNGCDEVTARGMLASLRENARLIREEARVRGKALLFDADQVAGEARTEPEGGK